MAVISQHLHAPPPRVSERRAELGPLDPVIVKAMAKDPRDRFATCSEFAQAFAQQAAAVNAGVTSASAGRRHSSATVAPGSRGARSVTLRAQTMARAAPGRLPRWDRRLGWSTTRWRSRPPPKKSRRWMVAVAGVVAVMLVATGVIVALNVGGDDSAAEGSSTPYAEAGDHAEPSERPAPAPARRRRRSPCPRSSERPATTRRSRPTSSRAASRNRASTAGTPRLRRS